MASIWDTSYGDTQRGIGWYPRREPARSTPSLWDYIEAAAMTPVPGVADVAAGLLAAKDFREGNYGAGALNAAGALPFVPALGGIFKGVKGATKAEKQALLKAQQMAREGADRDTIWNATLWYKGKDGKWRTEISDEAAGARFNGRTAYDIFKDMSKQDNSIRNIQDFVNKYPTSPLAAEANKGATVVPAYNNLVVDDPALAKPITDFFTHDSLFSSYPELAAVKAAQEPGIASMVRSGDASFNPDVNLIKFGRIADPDGFKSTTLHELQHAIQQREGMARGGSPEAMSLLDIAPPGLVDSIKRSHAYRLQVAQGRNANDALEGMLAPYMGSMGNAAEARMEAYKRLLGEVDARNTQKRMDMTLDQRREFPPWSTWDVPEADQIVRFGDGPAMLRGLLGR